MRKALVLPLLAAAVILAASACSSSDGGGGRRSADRSSAPSGTPLVGTNWVLTDESDLGVDLAGVTVTASFTATTVSGESGCNTYRGSVAIDGRNLRIGDDLATTQRACPGPLSAVEAAYLDVLPTARSYAISGTTLSLQDRTGTPVLVYRAGSAADLIGEWAVTSYYTGDAIQSVVGGVELTAAFGEGTIGGNGGCNRFSGDVVVDGDTIAIGPLASTLIGCPDPVGTQEQQYLAALELARSYEVSGDRLTLFREGGTIAVTFTRP